LFSLKGESVNNVFIDPNDSKKIFVGSDEILKKSTNGGTTWKTVFGKAVEKMAFSENQPFVYASFGRNVVKSSDNGDTWRYVAWDYSVDLIKPSQINAIAVEPNEPRNFFVGTDSGIYKFEEKSADTTAPKLTILTPDTSPYVYYKETLEIKAQVVDEESGISKVTLYKTRFNLSPLFDGVSRIFVSGIPGPLKALNLDAFPIITGDEDSKPVSYVPVVITSVFGNGRVVSLAHDGFFANSDLAKYDNKQFALNVIMWLDKDNKKTVYITTNHKEYEMPSSFSSLLNELKNRGYTVNTISQNLSDPYLPENGVLIIGNAWSDFQDAELNTIKSFVNKGGGLLLWGLGWSYVQYNSPKNINDYPMNKVGTMFGVNWLTGTISDPTNNVSGSPIFYTFNRYSNLQLVSDISLTNSGDFTKSLSLEEGSNIFVIRAEDNAGNRIDREIEVIYKKQTFASIAASSGTGGTISPSGTVSVNYGDSETFTISPDQGYKISDVKVDGVSVGAVSTYTFSNVSSDHTIEASFEKLAFKITSSAVTNGSISPSGTVSVNYGDSKTFTITPSYGYKISNVKVDGKSIGPTASYTFTNITQDHTIEATFEKQITEIVIILQIGSKYFTVNGETRTLDSPPIIKNNRTLLPIRAVVEALGGTVSWDAAERKVTITLSSTTIELWIGKSTAKVNGVNTPIDPTNPKVVPEIINSRTMLPLRFVTENLGCTVEWDGTTKTITIRYEF